MFSRMHARVCRVVKNNVDQSSSPQAILVVVSLVGIVPKWPPVLSRIQMSPGPVQ